MSKLACKEAQEGLAEDPLALERIALHRVRCDDCRSHEARMQAIKAGVLLTAPPLNDISRARILGELSSHFDELATNRAAPITARIPSAVYYAAAAVLLLVLAGLWYGLRPSPGQDLAIFDPYFAGASADAKAQRFSDLRWVTDGRPTDSMEAMLGRTLRARLGKNEHTEQIARIALIGPGRVKVIANNENERGLKLEGGLLLVRLAPDAHPRRRFWVRTENLEIIAMGTTFSVDARGPAPIISVLSGTVEVRPITSGARSRLGAGRSLGASGTTPLDETQASLLRAHEQPPPLGDAEQGALVVESAPSGAEVSINGRALGKTPLALSLGGPATVQLSAEGYSSRSMEVMVRKGQVNRVMLGLNETPEPTSPKVQVQPTELKSVSPSKASRPRPPRPTAEELYQKAEKALMDKDFDRSQDILQKLVREFPKSELSETALYELARLNMSRPTLAKEYLDELLARVRDPSIHESALYMRCRLAVEALAPAIDCLESFRKRFPSSPRDEEVLTILLKQIERSGGCRAAKPLYEEYLRRYPDRPHAKNIRAHLERCP